MEKKNKRMGVEEIIEIMLKDRRVRLSIVKRSHKFFFYFYFPHYTEFEIAPFHEEMFRITHDTAIHNAVIVAFRNSGKSTIFTTSFPLWAILGEQKIKFILILSQTQQKAQMILQQIKHELETNELLKRDLGPFQEERNQWNTVSLYLTRYNAKITAASTEQSVRGLRHKQYRPQLILGDDLEDLTSVRTKDGRDKVYSWLMGEVMPAGEKRTRLIIVGSLLHEDSLIKRLQGNIAEGKMSGTYRAYPLLDERGNSTWPGKFPDQKSIDEERAKGFTESAWRREYLLEIVSDEEPIIRKEWIKYYDVLPDEHDEEKFLFTATGIDLAISEKQTADFTAMVSARVYKYKDSLRIYILANPVNERLDFPATISRAKYLSRFLGNGKTTMLYVEDVAYQRSLVQQLRREGFPAEAVPLEGQDKRVRVTLVSPLIQSGQTLFPRHGAESIVKQLTGFGIERYDDLVDALTLLIMQIFEKRSYGFYFIRGDGSGFSANGIVSPPPRNNNPPTLEEIQKEADREAKIMHEHELGLYRELMQDSFWRRRNQGFGDYF